MKEQQSNTVSLLRQIVERRGPDYLREGGGKFFVNAFAELGGDKQDVKLLRYLIQCGGHEDLLNAGSQTPAMQRNYYSRVVQKLCDEALISEDRAHGICNIFWQAVYNTQPPISAPVPTKPQPAKTAEELFQEAQNCHDKAKAANLLRQSAEQGHPEAMLHLGFVYEYGNGIPKDPSEAFRWFRKAAEQGLAPAQDRVAYCYDKGFGVERDLDQAIAWCKKANNQNFPDAARHLRQLEEKKRQEAPDIPGNKPEFDIVNGALLKYNGTAAKVVVPGGVTRIGPRAFFGNDAVRSVSLPYGLIGMGKEAFAGCRKLREITIPGSVIGVHMDAFAGCRMLKKITLESGVQKLIFGDHLDQLGSVTIVVPDTVRSVTWSSIPDSHRRERMKYPKAIQASKRWTETFQQFFQENPDFRAGRLCPVGVKQLALLALAALLLVGLISAVTGSEGGRTRAQLEPYGLEKSIENMLLAGTEEIYTYPDGTWMEFYYDDAGQEIYRVYVNTENDIENLFEARYDDSGRLVYHQSFDGEGNLLRADSYDFHSSEDTAQRRITLGDGRSFQGQSTFDENGYETFTLNHQDGTKTVYVYKDGGVLTNQIEYDAAGEITAEPVALYSWEMQDKVYGPRQTVIGWAGTGSYMRPYVQGICGGKLKEYSVDNDYSFRVAYDPLGNPTEYMSYRDEQLSELYSHQIFSYDQQGNYTGYTETIYSSYYDGDYEITFYDEDGIRLSRESHYFRDGNENIYSCRYETELDDQGRVVRIRTVNEETGQPDEIEEFEYDGQGNIEKQTTITYSVNRSYWVDVRDGDWKMLSSVHYYPNGNIYTRTEYSKDGVRNKWTVYYENGQVERITEYNAEGHAISETGYYESGKIEFQHEYNAAGQVIRYTMYYENGRKQYVTEYDEQGEVTKSIHYNEDGTIAQ